MNKKELVKKASKQSGISQAIVQKSLNTLLQCIVEEVASGGRVKLVGFGSFAIKNVPAQTYKNLTTREIYQVPERQLPNFKSGRNFRNKVVNRM